MDKLELDPKTTALILIDLQHGIIGLPLAPRTGAEVIKTAAALATTVRSAGGTVIYVRIEVSEILHRPTDAPTRDPNAPPPPAIASQLVPESGVQDGDIVIVKRQWGAFYGTALEQQLRRRGIRTIMIGGIATNIGVESTAREAFDRGYEMVFVEDAMSTISQEAHTFAVTTIFPRMGRVRTAAQLHEALTLKN
jgi:nicotinamidase-related amidase